jgi:hypothetical protein
VHETPREKIGAHIKIFQLCLQPVLRFHSGL